MKNESEYYGIGEVLRRLRINRKLTQKQLANKLEISMNTIKQYENNTRESRYEYLLKLCDYFNVQPEYFRKENHYYLEYVHENALTYPYNQHGTIYREKNLNILKYREILRKFSENNNESTHMLLVLNM